MNQVWDPLRKKNVALTPEERVRQWFIGVLRDELKVPEHMMMSEVSMKFGQKPFRADILVYGRDTAPLMVVECKREDVLMSREVLEQALKYNLVLGVKYIVITNGSKTFGFRSTGAESVPFEQMKAFPDWETMQK
ncbi:MAG: type I restriction enzyme HsdR N-terminal domain-containing protein [Bacteroidales bacterium]|nr:type I restriction enzyme HsdR N-terminal domain-containing protein [Bacteroidales bacterium]